MEMVIEGIGNDVLFFIAFDIVILAVLFYYWYIRHPHRQTVHAAERERVNQLRERLTRSYVDVGSNEEECPICLNRIVGICMTSCDHRFCMACILDYWDHSFKPNPLMCPCCRQTVGLLHIPNISNISEGELSQHHRDVHSYNLRFSSEPRSLYQHLQDTPFLLRRLMEEIANGNIIIYVGNFRMVTMFLMAPLYLISPTDLVPESIYGIAGLIDDFLVLLLLLFGMSVIYRSIIVGIARDFLRRE